MSNESGKVNLQPQWLSQMKTESSKLILSTRRRPSTVAALMRLVWWFFEIPHLLQTTEIATEFN